MSDETASVSPPPSDHRVLKAAVIIMGVLLVVGLVVVITTIVMRAGSLGDAKPSGAAKGQFGTVDVNIGSAEKVTGMELADDRLAIRLDGPIGTQIVIVDTKHGVELGRVRLQRVLDYGALVPAP